MSKLAHGRLFCLLVVLGITVAAIIYPVEEANYISRSRPVAVAKQTQGSAPPLAASKLDERVNIDPFSPRGWGPQLPRLPVAVVVEAAVAPAVVAPEVPAGPPHLPFQFVGRMNDAGNEVIYLRQGDQMVLARTGETLSGSYKVISMNASQIEFLHLSTGETQLMSIPAPDS